MSISVNPYPVPRVFAELPCALSWIRLLQHAEQLDRIEITEFCTSGMGTWFRFWYGGYSFSVDSFGARIRLTVSDDDCAGSTLARVSEHFAALSVPQMGGSLDDGDALSPETL